MITREQVSADKLRGGFYTPDALVALCVDRALEAAPDCPLTVLEPSAGDGAFIRGIGRHAQGHRVQRVTAVEVLGTEVAKLSSIRTSFPLDVHHGSALEAAPWARPVYDVAVGNPPFVRFQFIGAADRAASLLLGDELGVAVAGVSNLWLPILLRALSLVRDGGSFAFVVPAELLTGMAPARARTWLASHCSSLTIDLLAPGSFPGVLQEVVVLSGRKVPPSGDRVDLHLVEHTTHTRDRRWTHRGIDPGTSWTRYLLSPTHLEALQEANAHPSVRTLSSVSRFSVSTVTGANGYFTVSHSTVEEFGLHPWVKPLLPRARFAPGLVFGSADYEALRAADEVAYLLDVQSWRVGADAPAGMVRYLQQGEAAGLPDRYKCRVRSPWYRVPTVPAGTLMMSKRSHHYPRMIINRAGVVTTDTIYRGEMTDAQFDPGDLVAAFHSSLTLVSAEIEGRSFGGGVLELVPTEVASLSVMLPSGAREDLGHLDRLARSGAAPQDLVDETDRRLSKRVTLPTGVLDALQGAREILLSRRLARVS